MKAKIVPIIALVFFSAFFLTGCEEMTIKEFMGNSPVYMTYDDLRSAIEVEQNVELEDPGKIYFKDNYIFIVEELKGIHIFDNADPSSPVKKSFIKVPGVVDMAISGYILYADSYVDLVAIDVQDISNIREAGRIRDIFPYMVPPYDSKYPMVYVDSKRGVVTGWEVKMVRERVDNYYNPYPIFRFAEDGMKFNSQLSGSSGVSGSGVGVGGSMARFGVKDKVLYVLDENTLTVFDITSKTSPVKVNDLNPGWGIETMFISGNNMFLGTTTGMIIYDIKIPLSPNRISTFTHARACDPVIVDDTLAYITLRTGTTCGGARNVLDVVNVKTLTKPVLVSSFALTNPHGLGKDGDLLFICDGTAGLKVFDASDPRTITSHQIYTYPNIKAFDVIPLGNVLILIGDDGLFQYSYSNPASISLLSKIDVVKKL